MVIIIRIYNGLLKKHLHRPFAKLTSFSEKCLQEWHKNLSYLSKRYIPYKTQEPKCKLKAAFSKYLSIYFFHSHEKTVMFKND